MIKKFILLTLINFIPASLLAEELPKRLYGSWQFTGTAGEAVIGEITITKDAHPWLSYDEVVKVLLYHYQGLM